MYVENYHRGTWEKRQMLYARTQKDQTVEDLVPNLSPKENSNSKLRSSSVSPTNHFIKDSPREVEPEPKPKPTKMALNPAISIIIESRAPLPKA